jgi:hypothetical protein
VYTCVHSCGERETSVQGMPVGDLGWFGLPSTVMFGAVYHLYLILCT